MNGYGMSYKLSVVLFIGRIAQFEITEQTRTAVKALIQKDAFDNSDYLSNLA